MLYSEPLFRPPAEAHSLIVQVTEGCAYNRCLFLPMYKGKKFRIHTPEEIAAHLRELSSVYGPDHTRVFPGRRRCPGHGDRLFPSRPWSRCAAFFPPRRRFATYGSVFSLADKSKDDLLKAEGGGIAHHIPGHRVGGRGDAATGGQIHGCAAHGRGLPPRGRCRPEPVGDGRRRSGGRSRSRIHAEARPNWSTRSPQPYSLLNLLLTHTPLAGDPDYRDFGMRIIFRGGNVRRRHRVPDDLPRQTTPPIPSPWKGCCRATVGASWRKSMQPWPAVPGMIEQ